ncbi:hypothetical protein P8452_36532 [Trifolium repens]|nr:hypothetical protein P8452_36532 [Trifolium repens]
MMSHSYQHSQPQQKLLLSQYNLNKLDEQIININIPEKSLSTSQTLHKLTSTATTTSTRSSFSFFDTKHYEEQEFHNPSYPAFPCCFNILSNSKRFVFGSVSSMDHTQLDRFSSLNSPSQNTITKKKIDGLQKKEELEREVTMLQRLLDQEEKVHQILDMVNSRPNGTTISIPNFLPSKMRELLGELAMVEGEIARLESQISTLQAGLKHEQEITKDSKSKTWNQGNLINNSNYNHITPSTITNPSLVQRSSSNVHERMAFETKALHFISKAIKGDYNLNDFSLNEKTGIAKNSVEQKENNFQDDVKLHERVTRKNGAVKPPSPMRDPRHPSPKLRERNLDMYLDLPTRSLLDPLLSEENDLKWQPNKLSESIMKCLNFIYVRLLRTSRATELEKSGPVSRSLHSSLSSRSFRVDIGSTPKPSLMLQKESRQQDPYGIFNTEDSIPRDIGPYKNLVIFTSSSMDSKFISSPSSIPLLRKLRILMSNLQTVDLKGLTNQHKLAFWINLYNACIMHGFIQYGVPSTPEKLVALMNKATLNIGGNIINAQAIEHFILRKRDTSNMKEAQRKGEWEEKESVVRELYGLEFVDPNVTFALCNGTRSSPAVRIYTGDGVTPELEKSKLDYLQASILATSNKRIGFPELILRNMLDFAMDIDSLVDWVCNQLPTSGTLRKSMVECFRGHGGNVKASTIVEKIPYDYEFQYLLTI